MHSQSHSANQPLANPASEMDSSEMTKPRSATSPTALLTHHHPLHTASNNLPQVTKAQRQPTSCDICIQQAQLQIKQPLDDKGNRKPAADLDAPADLLLAPDGGFGWWVVVASFLCSVIVDGILFSFGVLLLQISRDLGQSKGTTAWIGSLQTGFYLIVGPFVSYLSNKFGCRLVTMAGSVISFAGFALSYYARNIFTLCLTFGVLGGIGYGFIYLPAIVMVASYFERKRAFATGIAVCGSGIGGFVMAPFTQHVLKRFGWRGSILVLACINLICLLAAVFFRPIQEYNRSRLKREKRAFLQQLMVEEPLLGSEDESEDEERETLATRCDYHQKTTSRCIPKNPFQPQPNRLKTSSFLTVNNHDSRNRSISNHMVQPPPAATNARRPRSHSYLSASTISFATAGAISCSHDRLPTASLTDQSAASLARGPAGKQSTGHADKKGSTDQPTEAPTNSSPPSSMCDLGLLLSPSFVLFACSGFLTLSGFFIPFVYLVDLAVQQGSSPEAAALLLSVIGITNTLGRVFCGWISDWPHVNPLMINNTALILGGAFTALTPILCRSYSMLMVFAVVFGFSIACFAALRSVITIDLLGMEKLISAFGLLLLPQGIATMIGAPVAGWFYDVTGAYDSSFYAAGTVILVSGLICIPLPAISRWEKGRLEKKSIDAKV